MSIQVRSLVLITVLGTLFSFSLVGCQTSQGSRFSANKQPPVSSFEMQPPAMVSQATGTSDNAHASHQMPTTQMPALQTAGLSPAPSAKSFSGGGSGKCSSCK